MCEKFTVNQLNLQNLQRTRAGSRPRLLIFGSLDVYQPFSALQRMPAGCRNSSGGVLEAFFEFLVVVFKITILGALIYKPQASNLKKRVLVAAKKIQKRPTAFSLCCGTCSQHEFLASRLEFRRLSCQVPTRFTAPAVRL